MCRVAVAAALCACLAAPAAGPLDLAFEHAKQAIEDGDYNVALALMDEAVGQAPKEAKYRGVRGVAWLFKGEYAKGQSDLKAAIELNSGDAGIRYRPSTTARLSADALEHGRRQVVGMLRDRPAMDKYGEETDFLRRWAERKFAGEDFAAPIDWDPTPPLHSDAEHLAPDEDGNAAILLERNYTEGPKRGKPRPFEELWAGAVYELHNVANARQFVRLHEEAEEGKLSKEAFVAGILKFELLAAQRTRAFYVQQFLPWTAKKRLPTDPTLWFCEWWDAPESVLASFTDRTAYPWHPYAREHDWATVHRYWHGGDFDKAIKLLDQMRIEEGYEEDRAEVYYWLGRCLAKLNKSAEALAAYDESIRLDPQSAPAYRARGEVYEKLGEKTKAAADFARAKELERDE